MKIALVVPHFYPEFGGHEYYLARELSKIGEEVIVYTSDLAPTRYVKKPFRIKTSVELVDELFYVKRFPTPIEVHGVPFFIGLKQALLTDKPDIIHAQEYYKPCSIEAFLTANESCIPYVFTQHMYESPESIWGFLWRTLNMTFGKIILNSTTYATAVSRAAENFLFLSGMNSRRIALIPLGVDTSLFNPLVDANLIKENLGLSDKTVILYVGRLTRIKGIDLLLRAFIRFSKKFTDCLLLICGGGELRNFLMRLSENAKLKHRIRVIDYVPHLKMPFIYAACDVLILPSLREVFGLVLLEAMASGKPVIGSRVGGIPDVIQDGVNGFLIEVGNVDELASRLSELISNPELRVKMGRRGREISLRTFDYRVIARRTLRLYEHCVCSEEYL